MLACVGLIGASVGTPIAYACRFYYKPRDKRTSYHQVYLDDIHGGKRKQLTFDKSEKWSVQWVGKTKLAWIESYGVGKSETWVGYHTPTLEESRVKVVLFDLIKRKRRIVASGHWRQQLTISSPSRTLRGTAKFFEGENPSRAMILSPDGKKFEKMNPSEAERTPEDYWKDAKLAAEPEDAGSQGLKVTKNGFSAFVYAFPDKIWVAKDYSKCWYLWGQYAGSAGSFQSINEIDWKKRTQRTIIKDLLQIDFQPDERFWASSSHNKTTVALGKIQVWQRELWCGDLKTGKKWRVANGAVHGDSVAVCPTDHR